MKPKINYKKNKLIPKKYNSREVMFNSIGLRILLLFFIILISSELNLESELINIIIQLILIPSIITVLLVGIFGMAFEKIGGNFLKKYTIQIKISKRKLDINFFTILMYFIVLSIYFYMYIT